MALKLGTLAVALVLFLLAVVYGAEMYSGHVARDHEHSPSNYGFSARSTLRAADGVRDSKLCVGKTRPGSFTARAKGYSNGHAYTVKDTKFDDNANCNHTHHNLANHRAGKNPWGSSGDKTYWGEWSYH